MANEHSQIVPSMQPTSTVADFKFWCQKVLPLVYDDSLSYYEVLNKMVVYLNQVIDNINADTANVAELEDDFLLLQTYVNNFFDDIDQLVTYTERAEAAQTAAAASAISAASSASNSATSASNSAGSASSAATSALSALDAKDAAVAAKTAAETALASAQSAATNAANSATAASGSATAASGSATNAAASAASALQNFQLADAARVAAQEAAEDAQDVLDSIPDDYTDLSNAVSELNTAITQTAPAILNNAQGNPVLIKDGAGDYLAKKIVLSVNSGSERIAKIDRYGKNLFPAMFTEATTIQGLTITPLEDGGIQITGTFTGTSATRLNRITLEADDMFMPSGTVIISKNEATITPSIYIQAVPYTGTTLYVREIPYKEYNISDIYIHYFDIFISAEASGAFINTTIYPTLIYKQNNTSFEKFDRSTTELTIPASSEIVTAENVIALLNDNNTIITNEGVINNIEYVANSSDYINEQNTVNKALIAPVLNEMIADTALVANDFRIVGNTLYRITGNVASGGTLTPNTNCVATTVGAILKSLLSA